MRARRVLPVIATGLALAAGGLAAPIAAQAAPAGCFPYVTLYVDVNQNTPRQGNGFCDKNYFNLISSTHDKVSSWHFRGTPGTAACLLDYVTGREVILDRIVIPSSGGLGQNVPSWANDRADAVRLC
ncbi:hypothetical protein [Allokutzneria albata]|uniref:Peptidase inhibitor family I36 n=1 Tax=Allokutzneria albata TaxID=211114 RepID=A0A1G9WDU2_ALLAB|nr:hypothetical protein [Allokutzneria albata]SDM82669.1 hypothetical protein SAMN04489726_3553 [Allokutzneria albata]